MPGAAGVPLRILADEMSWRRCVLVSATHCGAGAFRGCYANRSVIVLGGTSRTPGFAELKFNALTTANPFFLQIYLKLV